MLVQANSIRIPLESKSVQCVITSPPYFNLRDYFIEGQIGKEEKPSEYVNKLVTVFREVYRVLKDDGVFWLNIGDSYVKNKIVDFGTVLTRKNLIGIPWRVAFALQQDGWILRQDIIWHKTRAVPEGVKDRCTQAHEYLFLFVKNEKYYWNYEQALEPAAESSIRRYNYPVNYIKISTYRGIDSEKFNVMRLNNKRFYKNKRSVWSVGSSNYKGAHFAVFPPHLVEPCVLITSREGDIIFDPFCGSGTVGVIAKKYNRKFIGIDLNFDFLKLAKERIMSS